MNITRKVLTFLLMMGMFTVFLGGLIPRATAASVEPIWVDRNPRCTDLGYVYGLKFDYPEDSTGGTYPIGTGTVTWSTDGTYVDWSSTFGIDAVIVKGGPNANLYAYSPESFGDDKLVSPTNPSNNKPYGLSHVEFCFDYEVVVSKTAVTSFTREWDWDLEKTADVTSLTLSPGQTYQVTYTVTADASYTDKDWKVEGVITIYNPDPTYAAQLTGVSDVISPSLAADVSCGVTFPYSLASGQTLTCTYSRDLTDGSNRTNTATVSVHSDSKVGGRSATAPVIFGEPTKEIGQCAAVYEVDTNGYPILPELFSMCRQDYTYTYKAWIGPYEACGEYQVVNKVKLVSDLYGNGTEYLILYDDHTIAVTVPCYGGCTLTPGYWKTHSMYGPAPYDDTWALLGENTPFFLSGKTYYQVLWTPPAGNAYYILAHQYIAAELNFLNGANSSAVQMAFNKATDLFNTYTPAQVAKSKDLKALFTSLAYTLDQYNNGYIGPGHCSE